MPPTPCELLKEKNTVNSVDMKENCVRMAPQRQRMKSGPLLLVLYFVCLFQCAPRSHVQKVLHALILFKIVLIALHQSNTDRKCQCITGSRTVSQPTIVFQAIPPPSKLCALTSPQNSMCAILSHLWSNVKSLPRRHPFQQKSPHKVC